LNHEIKKKCISLHATEIPHEILIVLQLSRNFLSFVEPEVSLLSLEILSHINPVHNLRPYLLTTAAVATMTSATTVTTNQSIVSGYLP
jgi:hypothetical protein